MISLLRASLVLLPLVALATLGASSCTTFATPRPLAPGEHGVSVALGGPLTNLPNIGQIPLPNVTVEGHHGIVERVGLNYGLHLLPLAYGVAGAHVGGTWQLFDQPTVVVPALSVSERLFGFTNVIDGRKQAPAVFGLSQTDLTASWQLEEQLVWLGGALYAPFNDRGVFMAPVVGAELHPLPVFGLDDWLRLQVEGRWLGPTIDQRFAVVDWVAPDDRGVITVTLGLAVVFGGTQP